MFTNAVKLFSIAGFDIKLDPSWLIIAAIITWSLGQNYFPHTLPGDSPGIYFIMAIVAMILFFASLLLHELAHSVIARRYGLKIGGITLFLFGGVAELESEPRVAMEEFWVAVAGPVMSVALAFGFWALSLIAQLADSPAAAVVVLSYLATINLILALFNLVPAFPLDGGRILRAWLWHRSGDIQRATGTATKAGVAFAYVLMGLGLLALFQGAVISAIWQIMIGGFLLVAARSAYQEQITRVVFSDRTVSDLMQREPITVGPDRRLSDLVDQVVLRHGLSFVPVVEDDILLGHIDRAILLKIDREHWSSTRVGDVFAGLDETPTIPPDTPVEDLMKSIAKTGQRKFLVVEGHSLLGLISLSDIVRHLELSDLVVARTRSSSLP